MNAMMTLEPAVIPTIDGIRRRGPFRTAKARRGFRSFPLQ